MKLDKIQELNNRLSSLLADPQPGLMSWCISLDGVMKELVDGWLGKDGTKK